MRTIRHQGLLALASCTLLITPLRSEAARMFWYYPPGFGQGGSQPYVHTTLNIADAMLEAINRTRARYHLPPVRLDPRLTMAAQRHADFMANRRLLSHTGTGGSDPAQRIASTGYNWQVIAENVAEGQTSVDEVVRDWMNSPHHRANMLKAGVTDIGVGYNGDYWALDLAAGS